MNVFVFHVASGHAFFTGVVLMIVAALASTRPHSGMKRVIALALPLGLTATVLSSTPMAYPLYVVTAVITAGWMLCCFKKSWRPKAAYLTAALWFGLGLVELPYHFTPTPAAAHSRRVAVIGDSVTAGVGGDEKSETWPSILAREHQLDVQDISHIGETAASALQRAKSGTILADIVVVEIGGNDLLGSTSSQQFELNLRALLAHLVSDGRQLIMFELPLPPLCHEYGRVQRSLARQYDVLLVPKRAFLSVIAGGDSTLDTIHLSQSGHQEMADLVWSLLRPAYEGESAN